MLRFFTLDARITRVRLIVGLVIAVAPAFIMLQLLESGEALPMIAAGAIGGATVAKLLCESVRRRHDADASGAAAVALLAGGTASMSVASIVVLGSGATVVLQIVAAAVVVAWVAVLLRPSSVTPNRYAPPVTHPLRPAFGEGRQRATGLLVAAALTISGAGLGYAGSAWLDGMRRHHEAIQRSLETGAQSGEPPAADPLEQAYNEQNRP